MFFSCSSRTDLDRDLVRGRGADDDREAGHRAVDQLDAEVALDRVRDEAVVDVAGLRVLAGLEAVDVAQREVDLLGEERRHAGVERLAEVRLPEVLLRLLVQQLLGEAEAGLHVAERLDLEAGHRVDHRQVERRVGELELEVLPLLGDGLLEHLVGSLVDRVSAPDGSGSNQFGHGCLLFGGFVFGGVACPPRVRCITPLDFPESMPCWTAPHGTDGPPAFPGPSNAGATVSQLPYDSSVGGNAVLPWRAQSRHLRRSPFVKPIIMPKTSLDCVHYLRGNLLVRSPAVNSIVRRA